MVVAGLAFGVIVSNSFARFSYGLILPAMQEDLHWSYTEAGWINTANALGYIAGAYLSFSYIDRLSAKLMFNVGMIVTGLSLAACGVTDDLALLTLWRIVAGVAGAPVFIAGGAMVATLFSHDNQKNALAIALYFGGAGVGMIASGALLPYLFEQIGPGMWRFAWIGLGVSSLILAPFSIWAASKVRLKKSSGEEPDEVSTDGLHLLLVGYGLFAMGYIVYLTFVVVWAETVGLNSRAITMSWVLMGIGIIVSPFLWRRILAKFSSGIPLAMACGITGLATAIPILAPTEIGFAISSLLFGTAVFIGPASITNFVKKNLMEVAWSRYIGLFTLVFACGQAISPVVAGFIGDATNSMQASLLGAAGTLCFAALAASIQRPLDRPS